MNKILAIALCVIASTAFANGYWTGTELLKLGGILLGAIVGAGFTIYHIGKWLWERLGF